MCCGAKLSKMQFPLHMISLSHSFSLALSILYGITFYCRNMSHTGGSCAEVLLPSRSRTRSFPGELSGDDFPSSGLVMFGTKGHLCMTLLCVSPGASRFADVVSHLRASLSSRRGSGLPKESEP